MAVVQNLFWRTEQEKYELIFYLGVVIGVKVVIA